MTGKAKRDITNAKIAASLCARARDLADAIRLTAPRSVQVGAEVDRRHLDGLLEAVRAAAFARLDGYEWEAFLHEGAVILRVTEGKSGRAA